MASYGGARPDVGGVFGAQFTPSGFGLQISGLPPGAYQFMVFGWVAASNGFTIVRTVNVTIGSSTLLFIDRPLNLSTVTRPFLLAGWTFDPSAPTGTGVDTIHVWAFPASGGAPTFVGVPAYGTARPDVGGYFGSAVHTERLQHGGVEPGAGHVRPHRLFAQPGHELVRRGAGGSGDGAIDRFRVHGSRFRVRRPRTGPPNVVA